MSSSDATAEEAEKADAVKAAGEDAGTFSLSKDKETININDLVPDDDLKIVTGKDRLRLANACLGGLLFVFCAAMFCFLGATNESKGAAAIIWADITKIVPPIATLVIGYFFGSRESS